MVAHALALFVVALVLTPSPCIAGEIAGVILEVIDGDSLRLGASDGNLEIRLLDIDAPELKQAKGQDARTSLRESTDSFGFAASITGDAAAPSK